MILKSAGQPIKWLRNNKTKWIGWGIPAVYLVALFLMARVYWHVKMPFVFLGIFLMLTVLVAFAFRWLYREEEGAADIGNESDEPVTKENG